MEKSQGCLELLITLGKGPMRQEGTAGTAFLLQVTASPRTADLHRH